MDYRNLALKMRPTTIDEVLGQGHLLGQGKVLRKMVDAKRLNSIILYGPPGIGKTSIARALAGSLGLVFHSYNASINGKDELKKYAKEADKLGEPMVILVDEIHRLTRPNQDFLLPYMEDGKFIIVGATTDNPYLTVAPAIRSRAQIFVLKPLEPSEVVKGLKRALEDSERGLGAYDVSISDADLYFIARASHGDMRAAYTCLEIVVKSAEGKVVKTEDIEEVMQTKNLGIDKNGDVHYNLLSALQKSIRGSDVDASIHYLARLIHGGDLVSICRRLLVIGYEDIGVARPEIAGMVYQAIQVAQQVGLPEARIPLAFIVVELALSPKSNSAYKAVNLALSDIESGSYRLDIPMHLRDTHFSGAQDMGHTGYLYPHDYDRHWVSQQYLPDELLNRKYFSASNSPLDREMTLVEIAEYYRNKNK